MRRFSQYTFLALFVILIACTTFPLRLDLSIKYFFRIDPLAALAASVAGRTLIPELLVALVVIVSVLVTGRAFCGYVCPLGTITDWVPCGKENDGKKGLKRIKFILLVLVLTGSVFGLSIFFIADPLVILARSIVTFLDPLLRFATNEILDLARPAASRYGLFGLVFFRADEPVFNGAFLALLLLGTVLGLAALKPRFWCRYCCPLGALLGLGSRISIMRRRVDEGCDDCGVCQAGCPMDAIADDPRGTDQQECIYCLECVESCPSGAVTFGPARGHSVRNSPDYRIGRRALLGSMAGGAALAFVGRSAPGRAEHITTLIRPPGALPEDLFVRLCIRCGACLKTCPTNTLQPCFAEAGLEGIWTPRHLMRLAGCEQGCNQCGQVCPTGAIRPLPLAERIHARVGTAAIARERCVAWEQDRLCLICDEACPYNAIVFKTVGGHRRPFVDEGKCNGCGICEARCPVQGDSAIIVRPDGEIRLEEGSYRMEARARKMTLVEEHDSLEPVEGAPYGDYE